MNRQVLEAGSGEEGHIWRYVNSSWPHSYTSSREPSTKGGVSSCRKVRLLLAGGRYERVLIL